MDGVGRGRQGMIDHYQGPFVARVTLSVTPEPAPVKRFPTPPDAWLFGARHLSVAGGVQHICLDLEGTLEQTRFACDQCGLGAVGGTDLAVQCLHMQLDGGLCNIKIAGDFLVRFRLR